MKVYYDTRSVKDPLGELSTPTRKLLKTLTQKISASLATGTASNYNSTQYGANHKIIYDGISEIFARMVLDIADLNDDGSYSDLRVEFLATKLTSLIFQEENTPTAQDDMTLKEIILATAEALIKGSQESAILNVLSVASGKSKVEITQVDNHLVKVMTSILSYTQIANGHRHFVFAPDKGLGSTLSPMGYSWGDALHQHDVIDGVVQPYVNSAGDSHTHEIDYGLPQQIITLQTNLRKILNTTKPAHVKIGEVSSLLGENITQPTLETITYVRTGLSSFSEVSSENHPPLCFSLGASFQENMRRARTGTYESIVFGYGAGKSVRLFRGVLQESSKILTRAISYSGVLSSDAPQTRRVVSLEEITPEDGVYSWSAPRYSTSGTATLTNGYFTEGGGNASLSYLGEGELILLDESAYFVEVRARNTFYLRALEITADNIATTDGFLEVTLQDYSWDSFPLRYRRISVVVSNDPADVVTHIELKLPVRKTYRGMPITKDYFQSVEGLSIDSYEPLTNTLTLSTLEADGTELTFLVPYGEGDTFSYTDLNSPAFVLNRGRKRGVVESEANKGYYNEGKIRGLGVSNLPSIGLFPALPILPSTTDYFSLKTSVKRTHGLNNSNLLLGQLVLNRTDLIQNIERDRVSDVARGNARVSNGSVPLYAFGFLPRNIISLTLLSDGSEIEDYFVEKGVLYIEGYDDQMVRLEAISDRPLSANQDWNKGSDTLSAGQVPFIDPTTYDFDPSVSISTPSVEELMSNPEGRRVDSFAPDSERTFYQRKEERQQGVQGEEVFYEDDLTEMDYSGFKASMPVLVDRDRPYAPNLVLNEATSLIGESTRLAQDPDPIRDYVMVRFL